MKTRTLRTVALIFTLPILLGCDGRISWDGHLKGKGYAPLVGEWKISPDYPKEKERVRTIGDTGWFLGETLVFKDNGDAISGKHSKRIGDEYVTTDQVCTYRLANEHQLEFDCGFGQELTGFILSGDSLTLDFWNMEGKPPIKYTRTTVAAKDQ